MRSRWDSGVKEAARQMSMIRCGLVSDLRSVRAARDFSLPESGDLESGLRIDAPE